MSDFAQAFSAISVYNDSAAMEIKKCSNGAYVFLRCILNLYVQNSDVKTINLLLNDNISSLYIKIVSSAGVVQGLFQRWNCKHFHILPSCWSLHGVAFFMAETVMNFFSINEKHLPWSSDILENKLLIFEHLFFR